MALRSGLAYKSQHQEFVKMVQENVMSTLQLQVGSDDIVQIERLKTEIMSIFLVLELVLVSTV